MNYYKRLAFQLRQRRCNEEQVLSILESVRESTSLSGTDPHEEFDSPEKYATQYRGTGKRTTGESILTVFAVLGILQMIPQRLFSTLDFFPSGVVVMFASFLASLVVGIIVAALVDHRLPRGFAASTHATP